MGSKIKLTDWASCAGCAAKLGQGALMQVLHQLPLIRDKDLLVGIETADDAGVYKISDELALISTLDFFPPIVDDPYSFGQIAAANALSDVYAMGGKPRLALNIVCFPKGLGLNILDDIIRGSMEKLNEAETLLIGGHSVEDIEIKYGLSVAGFVNPSRITVNSGARPGDLLILTKPVGTGVITSALKSGRMKPEDAEEVFSSMKTLNKGASEAMAEVGVNACTDVTGYGIIGHAMEMAKGSRVSLIIRSSEVRFFQRAAGFMAKRSNRPRTLMSNREFLRKDVVYSISLDEPVDLLLYDPQTSGGLLISVPAEKAQELMRRLHEKGVKDAAIIGEAVGMKEGPFIRIE